MPLKAINPDLSIDWVRNKFSYDERTGNLLYRIDGAQHKAGEIVGSVERWGYRRVNLGVNGKRIRLLVSRLTWFFHHGQWPEHCIDHINGDPSDNRIENLRDVEHAINMRNRASNGRREGFPGVWKNGQSWRASFISNRGNAVYLSGFMTEQDAIDARSLLMSAHGYHENHGRNAAMPEQKESAQ